MTNDKLIDIKNISDEEKSCYYHEWQSSGLKAAQFCADKKLPFYSFRCWCKRYQKSAQESMKGFSPVTLRSPKTLSASSDVLLDVGMKLPNDIQLQLRFCPHESPHLSN